jgi:hypothetical protein
MTIRLGFFPCINDRNEYRKSSFCGFWGLVLRATQ